MTSIDLGTGLPSLPEGRFWRVREKEPAWHSSASEPYVVVELIEKTIRSKRNPKEFLGIHYGWYPPHEEHSEEIIAYQELWNPARTIPDEKIGLGIFIDGTVYDTVSSTEIVPSMILEAAKRVLTRYEANQQSRNLIGDYPPKQLPEIENA